MVYNEEALTQIPPVQVLVINMQHRVLFLRFVR